MKGPGVAKAAPVTTIQITRVAKAARIQDGGPSFPMRCASVTWRTYWRLPGLPDNTRNNNQHRYSVRSREAVRDAQVSGASRSCCRPSNCRCTRYPALPTQEKYLDAFKT